MSIHRRAITLLELVVSLAIIAIILAITIPAVQSSRESARRIQCQSNLRQILLATQTFHNTEKSLPSLYNGTSLKYPLKEWDLFHMHSWRVPLLPHLEQASLRQQVKWDALATESVNSPVSQSVVPVYVCPSGADPATHMWRGRRYNSLRVPQNQIRESDQYDVVRSDYDAMAGIKVVPAEIPEGTVWNSIKFVRWGIWGWPVFDNQAISDGRMLSYRAGKFRDVADGLSNTLAVVERGAKPIDMLSGKPNVTDGNPSADYPGQVGWSVSNSFFWAINGPGVGVNESNSKGIYSLHPGGANVSMADGSVRFLSDSTDQQTLIRMFSRSAGPERLP